jgi:hypothetical protein
MKNAIYDILRDPEWQDPSLFDIQSINKIYKDQLNGKDMITVILYRLLTHGNYHKQYGPANSIS